MSIRDRRTQQIFGGGAGLAAVLVAGLLVVLAVAVLLAGPQLLARTLPSAPLVEESPLAQAAVDRQATEREFLDSYGWVDKKTGLAHIPVAEAMQRVAETGLPVGAPEMAVAPVETGAVALSPVGEVSFSADVLPILVERCSECHGDDDPEEGLEVTSYRTLMLGSIYGAVIKPGDVEGSYLFEQVSSGKMPKKGDRLTAAQIEIIRRWIEAGALDN
jgi:mono/diheme cytochrome c family protein